MNGYSVTIDFVSKELTPKERVMIKDTGNTDSLDKLTNDGNLVINVDWFAVLSIHNEKSDNKDYKKYVFVDKDGHKYVTGSESMYESFYSIFSELEGTGEEITLEVYKSPSKNYSGKSFITCSLV